MIADQLSDFTVTQFGYEYETSLSTGFHFIECPFCLETHLFLVTNSHGHNIIQTLKIVDDPRFPEYLSVKCKNCKQDIRFCTGDESENPFIEDSMLVESIEDWR